MSRYRRAGLAIALSVAALAAVGVFVTRARPKPHAKPRVVLTHKEQALQLLFAEIHPVKLANCQLERLGEPHDGGYLLCGNLLGEVRSAYSYGISGYDRWGCDVSRKLGVQVHEYDCFNRTRPSCPNGRLTFHGECIGNTRRIEDGRPFNTLKNQVRKNGDAGRHLVLKMDVEGRSGRAFSMRPTMCCSGSTRWRSSSTGTTRNDSSWSCGS
jgi:hypothetical protein